ncbi:MAG: Zn-dependent exopeptidase M28 [Kiritimatiellae bacterium]|nr:Zn-dependent exopeptidase M28 [Kiritimatiellia bacterium]
MDFRAGVCVWVAVSLAVVGCEDGSGRRQSADAAPVTFTAADAESALGRVQSLVTAFPVRDAGTPAAGAAARWLAESLQAMNIPATVDTFEDASCDGKATFHNVIGTLKGTGDGWIVLLSHFDTKSGVGEGFQGANDGGSSTGLVLELARLIQARAPRRHNILFGFMDGEECKVAYRETDGFHGSKRLARQLRREKRKVKAVILMDMVGDRDLKLMVPHNGSGPLRVLALQAADAVGERAKIGLFDGVIFDDHQAFLDEGFPAVDLIDFDYGSEPGRNDFWHTPLDTLDKLSAESLLTTGKIVLEMVRRVEEKD